MNFTIKEVVEYLEKHFKYAEHEERVKLAALLNVSYTAPLVLNPEDFRIDSTVDILEEVKAQMQMVRMMRTQILNQGINASAKELQSLVATSTSLFGMLTKYSVDIINQDRIKAIEAAVLEVVKDWAKEAQDKFFAKLEELLNE